MKSWYDQYLSRRFLNTSIESTLTTKSGKLSGVCTLLNNLVETFLILKIGPHESRALLAIKRQLTFYGIQPQRTTLKRVATLKDLYIRLIWPLVSHIDAPSSFIIANLGCDDVDVEQSQQAFVWEVKVIWQKAPHGGPIPRLGVTPGGRKLYHWIPGVGFPISVP